MTTSDANFAAADGVQQNAVKPTKFECCYMVVALFILTDAFNYYLGTQTPNHVITLKDALNVTEEGNPKQQLVYALTYGVASALLLHHLIWRARSRAILFLGTPLILLLGWSFLSTGWSDMPDVTVRRCIALLGTVVIGAYGALRFAPDKMVRSISYVAVPALLGSLALAVVDPSNAITFDGLLRGSFIHKNSLGGFAAFALFTLAARLVETHYGSWAGRCWDLLLSFVCIVALTLSKSDTPIPSLVVALALFGIARTLRTSGDRLWASLPIVAAVLLVMVLVVASELRPVIAESLGKDPELSGRVEIWNFVVGMIANKPFLGYGFGAFWQGMSSPGAILWQSTGDYAAVNAHNGYLQLLLDTGVVGGVLLIAAFAGLAAKLLWLLRHSGEPLLAWLAGFIGFFLVNNYSECVLWTGNDLMTMLFTYAVVRTNLETRKSLGAGAPISLNHDLPN